jgi:hypothetical protein
MTLRPQDVTDLYLAPVVLSLDAELDRFARLSQNQLRHRVAYGRDLDPDEITTTEQRAHDLLEAVTHGVEMHEWQASWSSRGMEITHKEHRIVLGIPANMRAYLDD